MRSYERHAAILILAAFLPALSWGGKWICPDTLGDEKSKEVMATSSPEVKVRNSVQKDSQRWVETVRPLIRKATQLAKEQRAKIIAQGVESSCGAPQQYVAQIIPVPEKVSGCDHKIVMRPADSENTWVQAVAVCKYDWACCTPEVMTVPSAGYSMEGPLNTQSSTSTIKKQ